MTPEQIITSASNGNAEALSFLRCYVIRAHLLDDLIDRDQPVLDEMLAKSEAEWIQQLTGNPFVLQHSARLVPVLLLGLNAWVDSNRIDSGAVRDVLKGQWHEVVHLVALLTGGWDALRKLTAGGREFDFEVEMQRNGKQKEDLHGIV